MNRIVGYEKEIEEVNSLRTMLINLADYKKVGIRIPRGLVLYGRPGVGKTVIARSLAYDDIALVEIKSADCSKDDSEELIQEAFKKAKEKAPSVLLLDELDKIAGTSKHFFMEDNDGVKKVLLQELDKMTDNDGVLVVATCNDIHCLGDALTRSGRFDRLVLIKEPNEEDRKKILSLYYSKIKMRLDFDIEYLARITSGYTGAELECIVNESGIRAFKTGKDRISIEDITKVMNVGVFHGQEGRTPENDKERRLVATHEAGHALVGLLLDPDGVFSASIIPQGESYGHLSMFRREGQLLSIRDIENQIAINLAGRIAEREILGELYIGGESDLNNAVSLAKNLLMKAGAYGYKYVSFRNRVNFDFEDSGELNSLLACKIEEILNSQDKIVTELVQKSRSTLDALIAALCKKSVLSKEEIATIVYSGQSCQTVGEAC